MHTRRPSAMSPDGSFRKLTEAMQKINQDWEHQRYTPQDFLFWFFCLVAGQWAAILVLVALGKISL